MKKSPSSTQSEPRTEKRASIALLVALVAGLGGFLATSFGGSDDAEVKTSKRVEEPAQARPPAVSDVRQPRSTAAPQEKGAPREFHAQVAKVEYHERDPGEWKGMRLDISAKVQCETSDTCQLSTACVDEICGACDQDSDCAKGEACVLDRCLLEENADCRNRKDCPDEELCMIERTGSDALKDHRGNMFLESKCSQDGVLPSKPQPQEEVQVVQAPDPPNWARPDSGVKKLVEKFEEQEL